MFSQDWALAFEPMEMYPTYPFPEKEIDPVRSFMTEYQAPAPITEQPFFAPETGVTSAETSTTALTQAAQAQVDAAAPVQAAGFLEGLPTWALLLGGGGLLLLLGKRR